VAIVKVPVVVPAGTVTEAGTVAAVELLLVNDTAAPPAGAGALSVMVPVLVAPLITLVGLSVNAACHGLTVRATALLASTVDAVIVTPTVAAKGLEVTTKPALVAPAGTVTDAGTVAAALLLARFTT